MRFLITYLLLGIFALLALGSCTNDEGGEDLDVITPTKEEQRAPRKKNP